MGGWVDEEVARGPGGGSGGGVSHQMHIRPPPPITIVLQAIRRRVRSGGAPEQMSQFVRFTPENRKEDGTGDRQRPPSLSLPLAPQRAPFGARMGPIICGKVIRGGWLRLGPCSGWISVPHPRVPFVSVHVHTSQATGGTRVHQSRLRRLPAGGRGRALCVQAGVLSAQ